VFWGSKELGSVSIGVSERSPLVGGAMTTSRRWRLGGVALLAMWGLLLIGPTTTKAVAASPPMPGYWLAAADGGVFAFNAPFYGSGALHPGAPGICSFNPQPPSMLAGGLGCSAVAATPSGNGYWILNAYKLAFPFGQSGPSPACTSLNGAMGRWTGIASSSSGAGYWATSSNGAVLGCGDAPSPFGDLSSLPLNAPIVGMAATPDRKGYWLAAADGGVFSFGDTPFEGSMGGTYLNAAAVAMAATPDGNGYWLATADGGIFSFGSAPFEGSMGGRPMNAAVVGIATYP